MGMRILHICPEAPTEENLSGGMGRTLQGIIQALDDEGVDQILLCNKCNKTEIPCETKFVSSVSLIDRHYADNVHAGLYGSMNHADAAETILHEYDIDVVHIHEAVVSEKLFNVCARHKKPTVLTIHLSHIDMLRREYHEGPLAFYNMQLELQAISRAQVIHLCSHAYAEYLRNGLMLCRQFDVVLNGVDTERFAPIQYNRQPKTTVMYAGRIAKQKNFNKVLELIAARPDWDFLICGDVEGIGDERKNNTETRDMLNLCANVEHFGRVSSTHLREIAREADCMVMPSACEPFGLVALEAMSMGVPLVTSGVDGLSDFCVHEQNCLIAGDYIEAIERTRNDETLRINLISGGLHTAAQHTWKNTALGLMKLYKAAMHGYITPFMGIDYGKK